MGLVADHDRVGVGDPARVSHEPLVGLDRDRPVGVVGAVEQRRREPLLVAAVRDLADELVDQVSPVGEDQDPAGARGVDEADRGDRLPGPGRVLEPEPPARAGILGRLGDDRVGVLGLVPVLGLLVRLEHVLLVEGGAPIHLGVAVRPGRLGLCRPVAAAVASRLALRALELAGDRGQRPGERIDLMLVELGAVAQHRPLVPEQPLEPEQQRVVAPPLERGRLGAGLELLERRVDRPPARRPRGQVGDRLALEQDRLTGELPHPIEVGLAQLARRACGNVGGIGHGEKGVCGPALALVRTARRAK